MSYINLRLTYLLTNRYRITDVRLLKLWVSTAARRLAQCDCRCGLYTEDVQTRAVSGVCMADRQCTGSSSHLPSRDLTSSCVPVQLVHGTQLAMFSVSSQYILQYTPILQTHTQTTIYQVKEHFVRSVTICRTEPSVSTTDL